MRLYLTLGVVPAFLLSLAVGCSPSADSGAPTPDAAVAEGEGGSDGGDGGTGEGGPSATCTVLGTTVLGDEPKELSGLAVAGTSLVFLSADLGLTVPPGIEKVEQDGTGRTSLYAPLGDRRVHSLHVAGDRVFFFETDNGVAVPVEELWSLPVAGGASTRVGSVDFGERRFVGHDATHLFVSSTSAMPSVRASTGST